jgi:uncharacterized protein (DUF1800 family)
MAIKEHLNSTKGIAEYKGAWGRKQVIHLLKRTTFGAKQEDIAAFEKMTISQAVDALITPDAAPSNLPVNHYETLYADTTGIALGATWINAAYGDGTLNGQRRGSLKAWWVGRLLDQKPTIHEKLCLFWHNHFAIEFADIDDSRFLYRYLETIRKNAFGPFQPFVKEITQDSSMLHYLNGRVNTKNAPDENYAREVQELFVIGKGPNSKYTENDVKEAAKALTGWNTDRNNNRSVFNAANHDVTEKKFSAFYGNKTIKGRTGADGANEVDDLLNILFSVDEVGKFLVRRFYTFFINSTIDATVEKNVIEPLAKIYKDSNYTTSVVLKAMFKSEHFHDPVFHGCMIKSPLDLIIGHSRESNYTVPRTLPVYDYFVLANRYVNQSNTLQQHIGDPPNVAGWGAYYQEPIFYDLWVNSDTYPKRQGYISTMNNNGVSQAGFKLGFVDFIGFAQGLSNPADPNKLLDDVIEIIFSVNLASSLKATIKKDILLAGATTDSSWTTMWNRLISTPADATNKTNVTNRLKALFNLLCSYPEYQLH